MLKAGGGLLAAFSLSHRPAWSGEAIEIVTRGNTDGSRVWFDPVGLHVAPGQTVRWVNLDKGNAHTSTAYHPDIGNRPRRIPAGAVPWNSDYLLPDEAFSATFMHAGVYDYYCVPHEHAGMVGRIVVGDADNVDWDAGWPEEADQAGIEPLPAVALGGFPAIADILRTGSVRPPVRS